jgi:hypothetical protein
MQKTKNYAVARPQPYPLPALHAKIFQYQSWHQHVFHECDQAWNVSFPWSLNLQAVAAACTETLMGWFAAAQMNSLVALLATWGAWLNVAASANSSTESAWANSSAVRIVSAMVASAVAASMSARLKALVAWAAAVLTAAVTLAA